MDKSNGAAIEGMESNGFRTSEECRDKCPPMPPKMFSKCDTPTVGSCSCVYEEALSNQCYVECLYGEWMMACAGEGKGDGPSIGLPGGGDQGEGPSIGLPGGGDDLGNGFSFKECDNCPLTFEPDTKCQLDSFKDCICSAYDDVDTGCFGARCFNGYWGLDCLVT